MWMKRDRDVGSLRKQDGAAIDSEKASRWRWFLGC